jgi:prolyl oligopeptidase PreP (S9A serine peptidase family)
VNDARTDPAHARKFAAALTEADADHGTVRPILLHLREDAGHQGGVQIDATVDALAREFAFLLEHVAP